MGYAPKSYIPATPPYHTSRGSSIYQLIKVATKKSSVELKLFLEVALSLDWQPIPPPEKTKEDILLFFKLYDPIKVELRYVGRLFVKGNGKPVDILKKLNEMAGFAPYEEIQLFEEIKSEPNVWCEHIDKNVDFRSSELQDGDIICFQKYPQGLSNEEFSYPTVSDFLICMHDCQINTPRVVEDPVRCFREFKIDLGVSLGEFLGRYLTLWKEARDIVMDYEASNRLVEQVPLNWRAWTKAQMDDLLSKDQVTYLPVINFPRLVSRVFEQWARDGAPAPPTEQPATMDPS